MTRGGLPHSDIPGSKLICSSPGLIAACHVLHRLLAPRHSPYTLSSLTIRNSRTDDYRRCILAYTAESAPVPMQTLRCLWSEKTTVCRIFSCQRSMGAPQPPGSLTRGARRPARSRAQQDFAALKPRNRLRSPRGARERPLPAGATIAMTSAQGDSTSLARSPKSFQRARQHHRRSVCHSAASRAHLSAAKAGGEYRARTGDLLVANQALSQLS